MMLRDTVLHQNSPSAAVIIFYESVILIIQTNHTALVLPFIFFFLLVFQSHTFRLCCVVNPMYFKAF